MLMSPKKLGVIQETLKQQQVLHSELQFPT